MNKPDMERLKDRNNTKEIIERHGLVTDIVRNPPSASYPLLAPCDICIDVMITVATVVPMSKIVVFVPNQKHVTSYWCGILMEMNERGIDISKIPEEPNKPIHFEKTESQIIVLPKQNKSKLHGLELTLAVVHEHGVVGDDFLPFLKTGMARDSERSYFVRQHSGMVLPKIILS